MTNFGRLIFSALSIASVAVGLSTAPAAAAATTVKVELWDMGSGVEMMTKMGMMMRPGMRASEMAMAPMGIMISAATVPAGEVTFDVTNISAETIHEMVLAPVKDAQAPLPYDEQMSKVDEDAAGHLGEVAELDPGASGSLTLTLKPGSYILYCNIPGHYASGMWTLLTVE